MADMMAASPREFAEAMRDLVERSQRNQATAVSESAYQMKLQVLGYFIKHDPDPETFERLLRERIADADPKKELSKGVCCQIMNSWKSGSWLYTSEGRLVLRALHPAELPPTADEDEDGA
jgi:hypothetical protein